MPAELSETVKDERALRIIHCLSFERHHPFPTSRNYARVQFQRVKQLTPKLPGPASNKDACCALSACSPEGEAAMHGMTSHMGLDLGWLLSQPRVGWQGFPFRISRRHGLTGRLSTSAAASAVFWSSRSCPGSDYLYNCSRFVESLLADSCDSEMLSTSRRLQSGLLLPKRCLFCLKAPSFLLTAGLAVSVHKRSVESRGQGFTVASGVHCSVSCTYTGMLGIWHHTMILVMGRQMIRPSSACTPSSVYTQTRNYQGPTPLTLIIPQVMLHGPCSGCILKGRLP